MQVKYIIYKTILLLMTFCPIVAIAEISKDQNTVIGRYLTTQSTPSNSQMDLLSQMVHVRFPSSVQSVGEAMTYLLRFSGYELMDQKNMHPAVKITLSKPLPVVDRELGPVSLKDGLLVLAGRAFYLVEDPINRKIAFFLKSSFRKSYVTHPDSNIS